MPKTFRHLTKEDRDTLAILLNRGRTLTSIARFLGCSTGTLSREIRRNTTPTGYRPHAADRLAQQRFSQGHRRPRINHPGLKEHIEAKIRIGWSPEIIAGRLKRERTSSTAPETNRPVVSHETIYQWVYADARHLIPSLVRGHRRRRHRPRIPWVKASIPHRISIDQRPPEANSRQQPGHWEGDLLLSAGGCALQVIVERKTRHTRLRMIPNKTAQSAYQALHGMLSPIPPRLRRTITYDNGLENTLHGDLNLALAMRSFFCAPYHSWEKGTIENTNGLIRRYLPKRVNFDMLLDEHVEQIEDRLNNRPRKCLGFQTSAEAYNALVVALAA
jgi:IS30 family transposase